jgi:hypothetical protein
VDADAGSRQDRLRVSDREREAVVERLNAATVDGRLTLEEYTDRSGQAYGARTAADLNRLVDDLPAASALANRPADRPPSTQVVPIGSIKRSGRWRLERDTRFTIALGSAKLDLRQAEVAAAEVNLHVRTVLGSVKVWVPRGVRVEIEGSTVVGSRKVKEQAPTAHDGPLLRLILDTVVGSVRIYRT